MNMKKKMTYVCPLSEIVPVKVESLLGEGISFVNHGYGDGNEGIGNTGGGNASDCEGNDCPPAPGKGWNFDDDDLGGVSDWSSMWD
ncbi:MAG: hypothetical protein IKH14_03865 [Prevotella sp.]|nr:hypothetical protein [Prevotella sp.]